MITICCILKTGGDYNKEYVDKLYRGVKANLSCEHRFICLTDDKELLDYENLPYCVSALKNDLDSLELPKALYKVRNYWAKLEIFRLKGPVLYFDLDTVIMGSLDSVLVAKMFFPDGDFLMLDAFNKDRDFASGVMAWNGDFSFLFKTFNINIVKNIAKYEKWDQGYIMDFVRTAGLDIEAVNKYLPGIYSYKHHCKGGVPEDASIICFHGAPRPHQVGGVFWE